jgi:hypothetical protein
MPALKNTLQETTIMAEKELLFISGNTIVHRRFKKRIGKKAILRTAATFGADNITTIEVHKEFAFLKPNHATKIVPVIMSLHEFAILANDTLKGITWPETGWFVEEESKAEASEQVIIRSGTAAYYITIENEFDWTTTLTEKEPVPTMFEVYRITTLVEREGGHNDQPIMDEVVLVNERDPFHAIEAFVLAVVKNYLQCTLSANKEIFREERSANSEETK